MFRTIGRCETGSGRVQDRNPILEVRESSETDRYAIYFSLSSKSEQVDRGRGQSKERTGDRLYEAGEYGWSIMSTRL